MVLFGMPLAQVILFGYAITTDVQNAEIAIFDQAKDARSSELSRKVLSSGYYSLAANVSSYAEIEESFKRGDIKLALVFPTHFARDMQNNKATIQLLADGADPNTASTLVSYMKAQISLFQQEQGNIPIGIDLQPIMHYNPTQKSVNMFVPGVITVILLLISAMLTSIAITREKEMGNMEILLVSPLEPVTIILGKVIPYLALSIVNVSFIISVGLVIFQVPLVGGIGLLFGQCLLFIVCALSLGVLISTVANSQQVALMMSLMGLLMPTILLSGFIFPISSMPQPLQWLSSIIPARYFIVIIKGVMLKGVGISMLWKETLILCGMTLFFHRHEYPQIQD